MAKPTAAGKHSQGRRRARTPQRSIWRGPWLIVALIVLIAVLVVVFVVAGRQSRSAPAASAADTALVQSAISNVSPSVLEAVRDGGLANPLKPATGATPLTGANGKPEMLYIGADWCPFCAAERWSLAIAAARFGTLSGISLTSSSGSDVYPNTATLSFAGVQYSSSYIDFVAVETETRDRQPIQTPTAQQRQVEAQLDPSGSIPLVSIANRYVASGAGYRVDLLTGKSWAQIGQALSDPNVATTRAILGNANWLTAAICKANGNQPAEVCGGATVARLEGQLGG